MKLGGKIFLLVLTVNLILIAVLASLGSMAFRHQFVNYINEIEIRRIEPLTQILADEYQIYGNWKKYIKNPDAWSDLLEQNRHLFRTAPTMAMQPRRHLFNNTPEGMPIRNFNPELPKLQPRRNLILADKNKQQIAGVEINKDRIIWIPINIADQNVGNLGYLPRKKASLDIDRLFVSRLGMMLLFVVLFSLFISLILSMIFTRRLVKPINLLKQGTKDLAAGNYQHIQKIRGQDEIADLARSFNWLAKTLDANLKSRQQWVADISHELRTPVAVLQAELESLLDGIRPLNQQSIESVAEEVKRLSHLIEDLHQLSLSDMGALTYKMEPINLSQWLDEFLTEQKTLLSHQVTGSEEIPAKLNWTVPEQAVTIQADETRLQQLLLNLLSNSLKYSMAPAIINVELNSLGEISWSDSSPGVPDFALPKLFERLYRVDGSRNRESGGSGLGLAICSNIMSAHQGRISAEHSNFGGVTIKLAFPVTKS